MDNIEGIVLLYRQMLDGFNELQQYAIDAQRYAIGNTKAYFNVVKMEDLAIEGERLLEKYKDIIIDLEAELPSTRVKTQIQEVIDNFQKTMRQINSRRA